jgi:hypothetical protein
MEEPNGLPRPAGWTEREYERLRLAIREEVARQLARLLRDPVSLCRILLFSLENPDQAEDLELAD